MLLWPHQRDTTSYCVSSVISLVYHIYHWCLTNDIPPLSLFVSLSFLESASPTPKPTLFPQSLSGFFCVHALCFVMLWKGKAQRKRQWPSRMHYYYTMRTLVYTFCSFYLFSKLTHTAPSPFSLISCHNLVDGFWSASGCSPTVTAPVHSLSAGLWDWLLWAGGVWGSNHTWV